MPGDPPTVLRHFTTLRGKDQRTVDYVGNSKVRINFLNKFYVDLTSILLTAMLLVAPWSFLFYVLSNWFSFRLTEEAPTMEAQQRSTCKALVKRTQHFTEQHSTCLLWKMFSSFDHLLSGAQSCSALLNRVWSRSKMLSE